jgi:hypothetical protein
VDYSATGKAIDGVTVMTRHAILVGLLSTIISVSAFATQNQFQSVLGGKYNPEKLESAKAILGKSKAKDADIRAATLKGYILAYLDQDFARMQAGGGKVEYCPTGSISNVEIKVSEYIINHTTTINEPFTVVIPEALRAQFPCH